jgi:hypothetical protein
MGKRDSLYEISLCEVSAERKHSLRAQNACVFDFIKACAEKGHAATDFSPLLLKQNTIVGKPTPNKVGISRNSFQISTKRFIHQRLVSQLTWCVPRKGEMLHCSLSSIAKTR